jgi:type VI secretion system secreted protein VgrG
LLHSFTGTESISRLFNFQLELESEQGAIAAKDIVGKSVTWSVSRQEQAPRYFNGFVSRFVAGAVGRRKLRGYRAEVVPWPWFLTRATDCRIFQNQSTPDIIQAVFNNFGFSDFELALKGSYPKREYCVQFRETAFNFVARLMEHEGIFFFFRHEDGKHTLVLADSTSSYADCPENRVTYSQGSLPTNHVTSWEHHYEFRSGVWTRTDYNFQTPSTNLLTTTRTVLDLAGASKYEIFDYPGEYFTKQDGEPVTKVRMEEEEAGFSVVTAASQCCTFTPCGTFTLEGHEVDGENASYAITSIHHSASEVSFEPSAGGTSYSNIFTCIPDSISFRPARATPKPMVQGPQTAVVVGPAGEEIYVDKYGRVKVQFFWDRKGKKDENSSCWVRVAEHWAGKNWGFVCNPRIGQEVLVDFLEGDPDRPLITGSVYNAGQMPPYDLPANLTQSGIKSRSSKGGSPTNFNEIRFEDKMGSEEVYVHAEKDFNRVVENNDTLKVGFDKTDKGDQTVQVYNNQSLAVGASGCDDGSQTITIWNNQALTVGNDQAQDGSQTITIYKDRTETVKTGNESVTIEQGNRTVTVQQGNDTHEVSQGNRAVTIDMGNDTLTIKMGNQTTTLNVGSSSTEAMQSIELKVGQNSIKIDQMGITLSGMMVKVQGQVQTQVQGTMVQVSGDAMTQISGGITMIG